MNLKDYLHVGTSGFSYKHWREVFYPGRLATKDWLSYYSKYFNSVELNTTFYALPKADTVRTWYEQTPEEFKFILKGPKLITHYKKLKSFEESLAGFFERVSPLQDKLDIIIWQFPPNLNFDEEQLFTFVDALNNYPYRYAFEFRHRSFFQDYVYNLLTSYNDAIVLSDWPFNLNLENQNKISLERRPEIIIPQTSNFIYLRRHGPTSLYSSSYSDAMLLRDSVSIKTWIAEGNQVYQFFNNDAAGYAIQNALTIKSFFEH